VTGGANGIGRSLALRFARERARLVIADLDEASAERMADEIRALGVEAIGVGCDITEPTDIERLAERTIDAFGAVNVLCNIAGVQTIAKLHETEWQDIEWLFSVNVFGLCHTVRRFVPHLQAAAGRGEAAYIINASSGFGIAVPPMGSFCPSAYAGTKHAVVGLSDAMRGDLADDGIGVSVVCPGVVNTQTWTSKSFRQARFGGPEHGTERARAVIESIGQDPDETAELIFAGVCRGDFYILPLNKASVDTMRSAVDERYAELVAAFEHAGR
jgi:NAD(P)-dependent dehydrogenase (short-subunit alcohol dehydrogenase family)